MADKKRDLFLEGLECKICSEILKDPRILPCGHGFCFACLYTLPLDSKCCPVDCQPFEMGSLVFNEVVAGVVRDIGGLGPKKPKTPDCEECVVVQADVWCGNCSTFFCSNCEQKIHCFRWTRNHQVQPMKEKMNEMERGKFGVCGSHEQEEQLYCEDCEVSACSFCIFDDHPGHTAKSLFKKEKERRVDLKQVLDQQTQRFEYFTISMEWHEKTIRKKEKEIESAKVEIAQREKEIETIRGEVGKCKEISSVVATASNYFGLIINALPLAFVGKTEVEKIEERVSHLFGSFKCNSVNVLIAALGGGGQRGISSPGKAGQYCSAHFCFEYEDVLTVVVGERHKSVGKEGESSYVISSLKEGVVLGAGGGDGGNSDEMKGNQRKVWPGGVRGVEMVRNHIEGTEKIVSDSSGIKLVLGISKGKWGVGGTTVKSAGEGQVILVCGKKIRNFGKGNHTVPVRDLV